jgi:hypothetical protein
VRGAKQSLDGRILHSLPRAPRRDKRRDTNEADRWLTLYRERSFCQFCKAPNPLLLTGIGGDPGWAFIASQFFSIEGLKLRLPDMWHLCADCVEKCYVYDECGRKSAFRDPKRGILARFGDTDARFLTEMGLKRGEIEWM